MKRDINRHPSLSSIFLTLLVLALLALVPVLVQSASAAQSSRISVNVSPIALEIVVADMKETELISIDVAGADDAITHVESKQSTVMLALETGAADGLYRYEVHVVDEISGKTADRLAGGLTVKDGQFVMPSRDKESGIRQSLLQGAGRVIGKLLDSVFGLVVTEVYAVDLTASSALPTIQFDDTDSTSDDWRIFTNHDVATLGNDSIFRLFKGGGTVVLDVRAQQGTYTTNLEDSLRIDNLGDIHFANDGMFFDRSATRLGIGITTPGFSLDTVGNRIRLRNNTTATARTIMLRADGTATDVHVQNSDLFIRADDPAPANIFLLSNRVGVGTTGPDSKLHVIGQAPPQFIVQNDAGNARMDFRRSASNGVSQLLFGTGPLVGGTTDYQIGMFLDSVFQIRVTNDSTRGISLGQSGNVGIGTTAPIAKLDVNGIVNARAGFTNISDVRLKDNIAPIQNALGKVMQTDGVSFTWRKDEGASKGFPEGAHYGVVAQQVEKVMPEVVMTAPNGEKAVSYTEMVPVLVEAIKEQQKIIEQLREEIAAIRMESKLKGRVASTSFAR